MANQLLGGLFLILFFANHNSQARPMYAIRAKQTTCASCHYQPAGGGPRTVDGKLFQSRWFDENPFLVQEYASADWRGLYYQSENHEDSKGGMGIMSGSLAVHPPLNKDKTLRLVIEHNIAGFSQAPYRDSYVLFDFREEPLNWIDSLLVGRIRVPFGIVTDEHRTYTRIQTQSRWFDFDTGLLLSGTPSTQIHYDLAAINGKNNTGSTLQRGGSQVWGGSLNVRYMPSFYWLGASLKYYETDANYESLAGSLYSLISLTRATGWSFPLEIKLEYTQGRGFNSLLNQGKVSEPAYAQTLENREASARLVRLDYFLSRRWVAIYQYDYLTPDISFSADFYERHGFGVRWFASANVNLQFRTELARATHPSESDKEGLLAQDAQFLLLEGSF